MTNEKKGGDHLASESGYDYVDKSDKPTTDSSGGDAIPRSETSGSGSTGSGKGGNTGGRGGGAQGAGASSESEGSHGGS